MDPSIPSARQVMAPHPPLPLSFGAGVLQLALAFALALFVVSSLVWWTLGFDPVQTAPGKVLGILGDALLAASITAVLWRMRNYGLCVKALVGCGLSLALAPISGLIDWGIHAWFVHPEPVPFDPAYFGQVIVFTTAELFAWSCLYLAFDYSTQIRRSERRLAEARQEALSAQMRALQYQVNPHFLFNTLNSVGGLIEEGEVEMACEMLANLAFYLRRTLELDPQADVSLMQEIELQLDYLRIERVRFSDRLKLDVEIEPGTARAKVPPLILQPLVENAVKHGVSRRVSGSDVTIRSAARKGGSLSITIENAVPDDDDGGVAVDGLGLGLANVASRLEARYPGRASLTTRRIEGGRMQAELLLPFIP